MAKRIKQFKEEINMKYLEDYLQENYPEYYDLTITMKESGQYGNSGPRFWGDFQFKGRRFDFYFAQKYDAISINGHKHTDLSAFHVKQEEAAVMAYEELQEVYAERAENLTLEEYISKFHDKEYDLVRADGSDVHEGGIHFLTEVSLEGEKEPYNMYYAISPVWGGGSATKAHGLDRAVYGEKMPKNYSYGWGDLSTYRVISPGSIYVLLSGREGSDRSAANSRFAVLKQGPSMEEYQAEVEKIYQDNISFLTE